MSYHNFFLDFGVVTVNFGPSLFKYLTMFGVNVWRTLVFSFCVAVCFCVFFFRRLNQRLTNIDINIWQILFLTFCVLMCLWCLNPKFLKAHIFFKRNFWFCLLKLYNNSQTQKSQLMLFSIPISSSNRVPWTTFPSKICSEYRNVASAKSFAVHLRSTNSRHSVSSFVRSLCPQV